MDRVRLLEQRLEATERRLQELEFQRTGLESASVEKAPEGISPGAEEELPAPDPVLTERVADVEKFIESYNEREAKAAADAAKSPSFEIGGRIQLDHWAFPDTTKGIDFFENPSTGADPEDRIAFRRIRLEIDGDVFDTMLYRVQVDFNNPSTPEYKDVYLGFQELPYNQTLYIGNQKRPLGLDQWDSSRFIVFMERPLVNDAFNEDYRRLGVQMRGYSDDEVYSWQYGIFNLENTSTTGRVIGDSLQGSANARLASSPWYDESSGGRGYFHWAVAGMLARPDGDVNPTDSNNNEGRFRTRPEARSNNRWLDTGAIAGADWYEILGWEAMLNIGALQLTGEYQTNWVQRDSRTPGTGPDLFFHGAYVYVSYFLTGEHVPYDRRSSQLGRVKPFENFFLVDRCTGDAGRGWGAWQVALRYSYLDLTDNDIRGGVEQNVTFGLNWHWNSHARMQFNVVYGDIEQHAPVGGFTGGHFTALGTRVMVDF